MPVNYAACKNRPKETREERDKRELAQIEREEKMLKDREKALRSGFSSGKNRPRPVGPGAYGTNKYRRPMVGEGEWLSTKGRRAIRKIYEDQKDSIAVDQLLQYRWKTGRISHKQESGIAEGVYLEKYEQEIFDREMKKYQTQRMNKEARREIRGFSGQRGRTSLTQRNVLKKKKPGKTLLGSPMASETNIKSLLS